MSLIKPKVNYVIATYAGTQCNSNREPYVDLKIHPQDYLKHHLRQLLSIPHSLSQVTIMKARTDVGAAVWDSYYDIDDIVKELSKKVTVKIYNVANEGISYGQYIKAYELDSSSQFDYWIFMEDDYIPVLPNFDFKLIEMYNVENSLAYGGLMCAWAANLGNKLHAAHSLCIVNNKTMFTVFSDLKKQLSKIKTQPSGGHYQLEFSKMFTDLKFPITDYSSYYYTPYWHSDKCVDCCVEKPVNDTAIFVPLQLGVIDNKYLFSNIEKHSWIKKIQNLKSIKQMKITYGSHGTSKKIKK
jgi:hypothetical protein